MSARDPALAPIVAKVERGARLTRDDGLALFHSSDLLTIGRLGDLANRRRNGDRVYFAANQHINPTNVCVLRNTCVFCSFARMPREDGAYTRSLDEVFAEADAAHENPTREFHIVGGLHPKLRLTYYRSEEHTSELQSRLHLVCRLLLEKKKVTKVYSL